MNDWLSYTVLNEFATDREFSEDNGPITLINPSFYKL